MNKCTITGIASDAKANRKAGYRKCTGLLGYIQICKKALINKIFKAFVKRLSLTVLLPKQEPLAVVYLNMEWHIGCSGFHYKHWRGKFYPEDMSQKKWFDFYCQYFKTLELNVTFYRFPQLSFLQNWYNISPADFRFAVKAPRAITHYRKFINTVDFISSFYDTISNGLQDKLGPVLFQLPPNFQYSEDKLERVINGLDPTFNNVFEPRHLSWWNDEVYKRLAEKNISFCGMSYPGLPDDVIQNTDVMYYRFHGVPDLYSSPYSVDFLTKVLDTVKPHTKQGWFYFNNDVGAVAPANAQEMLALL